MAYDCAATATPELLRDWAAIMRALRERDVIRTNNNPVGDIAEAVVHAKYGGTRASFNGPGWDVQTEAGERIQVKAIRTTATTKRKNLSPIRDQNYDSVVIVCFNEDFEITAGLKMRRATAEALSTFNAHVNGRILRVNAGLLEHPDVEQIDLSEAYLGISEAPTAEAA